MQSSNINMAAFAAAIVALNNARAEVGKFALNMNADEMIANVQISMCGELIKSIEKSIVKMVDSNTELNMKEKQLVVLGAHRTGYGLYNVPNKIITIKNVRERTGCGLLEAKTMVETYLRSCNLHA
jgi:ribosomal protein L7/L12